MDLVHEIRYAPVGSAVMLATFGGITAASAVVGAAAGTGRGVWYQSLAKPSYQPPGWVFGPVWTGLYGMIALSGWRTWQQPSSPERTQALALWGAQMALNTTWSWLFFGWHKPRAALVDIGLMAGSIAGYMAVARKVNRRAAWLMAPYLAWVGFAGALNAGLVRRNRWRL